MFSPQVATIEGISEGHVKNDECDRFKIKITLLAVIMSTLGGFLYWLLRYGFDDNSILVILKILSVSYLLSTAPYLIGRLKRMITDNNFQESWFTSEAFLTIAVLCFIVFLGYLALITGVQLIYFILLLGFVSLSIFLIDYLLYYFEKIVILYIVVFVVFSLFIFSVIWSNKYQSPLFLEKIYTGSVTNDSLSQPAISNSIKTYGVPSISIDGIKYFYYHWGSHLVYAFTSGLIEMNSYKFYNVGYPIIFLPLYFKGLLLFIIELKKYKKLSLKLGSFFFIFLFGAYIGIFSPELRSKMGSGLQLALTSESYLLGMALLFLLFSTVVLFIKNYAKENLISNNIFLLLFLPLSGGFIGLTKISLLFFICLLYLYLFIRMKWYKKIKYTFLLFFLLTLFVFLYIITVSGGLGRELFNNLSFFSYLRTRIGDAWFGLFFIFNFIYVWIFIILFLYHCKIKSLKELKDYFFQKKALEIEILFIIIIPSIIFDAIFNLQSDSVVYFYNFPRWIGLGFVLTYLPSWDHFFNFNINFAALKKNAFISYLYHNLNPHAFFLILVLSVGLSYNLIHNYLRELKALLAINVTARASILDSTYDNRRLWEMFGTPFLGLDGFKTVFNIYTTNFQSILNNNPRYQMLRTIEDLNRINIFEKKESAIYIPPTNKIFWEMPFGKGGRTCLETLASVVPAITGIAMIRGVPDIEYSDLYGYRAYCDEDEIEKIKQKNKELDIDKIKSIVKRKGFNKVIIIKQQDNQIVVEKIKI